MEHNISGQTFFLENCCACGVSFLMPVTLNRSLRNTKASFYCPNGHGQSYTRSTADKMREENNRMKQRLAQKDDEIKKKQQDAERQKRRAENLKRRLSAQKGVTTRLKKRAKAGLCPCCNRSFENLKRHMESQHKDWSPALTGEAPVAVFKSGGGAMKSNKISFYGVAPKITKVTEGMGGQVKRDI